MSHGLLLLLQQAFSSFCQTNNWEQGKRSSPSLVLGTALGSQQAAMKGAAARLRASLQQNQNGTYVEICDSTGGSKENPQTIRLSFAGSQVAFVRPKQGTTTSSSSGSPPQPAPEGESHAGDWVVGKLPPVQPSSEDESTESFYSPASTTTALSPTSDFSQGRRPAGGGGEEPFYITTHEIQLCEVDHQLDDDSGPASRWQFEDNNVIYSLVDYASFGTEEGESEDDSDSSYGSPATTISGEQPLASDSTELVSSSATSTSETDTSGTGESHSADQIHLSIKAAAQTINEPSKAPEKQNIITAAAKHGREKAMSQSRSQQQEVLGRHFIAMPGRLQTRGYCRPAEVSSGASSAVSELDDADKEVRSLTARAFRSLAYPYFEALHFSSSESSSVSEQHRCSSTVTLIDSKGGEDRVMGTQEVGSKTQQVAAPGDCRFAKPPGNAAALVCSRDGVTESMPREPGAGSQSRCLVAAEAIEGPQKSQVASSLLKSVISKKMQLEQQFRMEQGEITDISQPAKELEGLREKGLQRQNSCYSEASSDHTICTSDDLGELFDVKLSPSRECIREPQLLAAGDAQKSAAEVAKGLFLRSQNSAFRSWHNRELQKADWAEPHMAQMKDCRADLGELSVGRSTKMSRLCMPGVQQHSSKEKLPKKQATNCSAASVYMHQSCFSHYEEAGPPTAQVISQTPNIQVTTRTAPEAKDKPFNIAKLLTPNLAPNPPSLAKASEDRGHVPPKGEEKLPHFHVRDVRDSQSKTRGTIHQVRDVRKLIKNTQASSTTETTSRASATASAAASSEQSCPNPKSKLALANIPSSLSPVVITCQAVKSKEENLGARRVQGSATSKSQPLDTVLVHRTSGRLPVATIAPNKSCPQLPIVKTVSKASTWKLEKPKEADLKEETSALERLTAAVKSMEELYTFEQHEWKRKDEPLPVTNSHVLLALASQEKEEEKREIRVRRGARAPGLTRTPQHLESTPNTTRFQWAKGAPGLTFQEEKGAEQLGRTPGREPTSISISTSTSNSLFTLSSFPKAPEPAHSMIQPPQSTTANIKPPPPPPISKGTYPLRPEKGMEKERSTVEPCPSSPSNQSVSTDYGNYLTIPVKGSGGSPPKGQSREMSEKPMPPPASMHQPSPLPLLFSPPLMPVAPPDLLQPPSLQRKVLMDLSTGQCYVLEVPKRRLYDPENGQYVEVAVSPAPLPISPLALSPGAYGPAYMLYPGFLPTATAAPLLPASTVFSDAGYEVPEMESPYFLATGKSAMAAATTNMSRTSLEGKSREPQVPRLMAPLSFDSTAMKFIVEHQ
ncbi:LOW QUALITY PROTEIN: uncharacterized protein C4orf54 homolog [Microcaecilia unicolor]|uniref:LOW QUALITY PROTEIN: uncharacterized protein C4orf54 homolog n=1 Tax=Microcaecilia unicolor TaxID=1415580 RepID=A0A6P7XCX6_9AMPH|nr:LOW QUALITY PROTEIN: uncharacterized protein C4orf54 homolog [Microcaecilia unicolor]